MIRRLAAVAALALAVPLAAHARPAVIRIFEAAARAEPSADASIVERFAESAEVSVSEEATDGWRRVRLKDGSTGWIEDSALTLLSAPSSTPPPPAAMPPPPPAVPRPDLRPRIYLSDLDQLAAVMKEDAKVGPMAQSLVDRRRGALTVGGVGFAAGVALSVAGGVQMANYTASSSDYRKTPPGVGLAVGGLATVIVTSVVVFAILPKHGDLLDVVNAWNIAHPDRQVEFGYAPASMPVGGGAALER